MLEQVLGDEECYKQGAITYLVLKIKVFLKKSHSKKFNLNKMKALDWYGQKIIMLI